jgi:Protein of unknown function (DUF1353)
MGRKNLTPKKHLGRTLDKTSLSVSRTLAKLSADAAAKVQVQASSTAESAYFEPDVEASEIEDMAVYQGADVLFASGKEGPITALAIILIPEENRQNRRIAALAANFGFVAHISPRKKVAVAVPEGYVTDFASIPGFAQWMISPFGRHSEAAVVHDWLYTLGTPGDAKGRKLADMTFRRALKLVGVGWFRRSIMYRSVRMGGKSGYGLTSDYDFRDLVELKQRKPLPDKGTFAYTWKEADIPRAAKAERKRAKAAQEASVSAAAPVSQAEAKQDAQDTMVATKAR